MAGESNLESILGRMIRIRVFGKSPIGAYLRLNGWIWNHLPRRLTTVRLLHSYGIALHTLARIQAIRRQSFGTFFFRNRPELELIRRLSDQKAKSSALNISVLGCSIGAEVYSILWAIRSARPDLKVTMHAVDISKEVLDFAQKGVCSFRTTEFHDVSLFERMTEAEMLKIFDREGGHLKIQPWIKEEIIWRLGDAGDPGILNALGPQDIVVANRFLCHMDPPDAERCLRNIARLVKPGGHLFVSGIDLDIRTKVARDLGWEPLRDLMEDIHEGDPCLRRDWPCGYTGLEPFNKRRRDWKIRYASVFQLGEKHLMKNLPTRAVDAASRRTS